MSRGKRDQRKRMWFAIAAGAIVSGIAVMAKNRMGRHREPVAADATP